MSTSELEFERKSLMPPTEFSRRGFLTTSLIAGFTLAAGPVNAQSVITTAHRLGKPPGPECPGRAPPAYPGFACNVGKANGCRIGAVVGHCARSIIGSWRNFTSGQLSLARLRAPTRLLRFRYFPVVKKGRRRWA